MILEVMMDIPENDVILMIGSLPGVQSVHKVRSERGGCRSGCSGLLSPPPRSSNNYLERLEDEKNERYMESD